ncbi:MAG TPA: Hpt domain-containing protein, partial [Terriglobales bacterium]|nr:Hpt domain-containing protein [Terriglobales bacterium]
VMDGYEATRLLRLDSRYVNLPIVAMTAHAMADERERCQVLGMNGHVSKPIDPEMLYATLAEFNAPGYAPRPGPVTSPGMPAPSARRTDDPELPEIFGLDVHAGLRHAGGKISFYSQLLLRFARDFGEFARNVESMLAAGQWEDAAREAHTLKGLVGSLGANEIQPLAAALENAARAHDIAAARTKLASTVGCLAPLVSALRVHFGLENTPYPRPGAVHASTAASAGVEPPQAAPSDWLDRFRGLLQEGDVEAKQLWESRQEELADRLPLHVIQRISLALNDFEFDAALSLLPENAEDQRPALESGPAK